MGSIQSVNKSYSPHKCKIKLATAMNRSFNFIGLHSDFRNDNKLETS